MERTRLRADISCIAYILATLRPMLKKYAKKTAKTKKIFCGLKSCKSDESEVAIYKSNCKQKTSPVKVTGPDTILAGLAFQNGRAQIQAHKFF